MGIGPLPSQSHQIVQKESTSYGYRTWIYRLDNHRSGCRLAYWQAHEGFRIRVLDGHDSWLDWSARGRLHFNSSRWWGNQPARNDNEHHHCHDRGSFADLATPLGNRQPPNSYLDPNNRLPVSKIVRSGGNSSERLGQHAPKSLAVNWVKRFRRSTNAERKQSHVGNRR